MSALQCIWRTGRNLSSANCVPQESRDDGVVTGEQQKINHTPVNWSNST
jgi:hypothetical protein